MTNNKYFYPVIGCSLVLIAKLVDHNHLFCRLGDPFGKSPDICDAKSSIENIFRAHPLLPIEPIQHWTPRWEYSALTIRQGHFYCTRGYKAAGRAGLGTGVVREGELCLEGRRAAAECFVKVADNRVSWSICKVFPQTYCKLRTLR